MERSERRLSNYNVDKSFRLCTNENERLIWGVSVRQTEQYPAQPGVLPCLCVVIPCFNEEDVIETTVSEIQNQLTSMQGDQLIHQSSFILLVDDGSVDNTWTLAKNMYQLHKRDSGDVSVVAIRFSRNRGHQTALVAGLIQAAAYADVSITVDADLQDDISVMRDMVIEFRSGKDIVYGVRSKRDTDSVFKRQSAQLYYRLMKKMGVELVYNHADYRLLSRRVMQALEMYPERNLFLRGLIPQLGYPYALVPYERKARENGESKYGFTKMLALAWEGITSFSIRPIRFIGLLGVLIFMVSIGILIYILVRHLNHQTVQGWSTLAASVWAIGGLQILSFAVIGEYIGKIYLETKKRPRYFIQESIGLEGQSEIDELKDKQKAETKGHNIDSDNAAGAFETEADYE